MNTAAYNLGQLVGAGQLDAVTVARELLSAALGAGLSESEAEARGSPGPALPRALRTQT